MVVEDVDDAVAVAVLDAVVEAVVEVVLDAVVDADAVLEVWDDAVAVELVASSSSVLGCLAAHPMTNSPNARA
ncbi:MAG: hypothetical protein U0271_31590 [Polyangiaceae bacterium]